MIGLDIHGRQVCFKATRRDSMEYQILAHLISSHLRSNPRNHTIPVNFIPAGDFIFMVMPCWGTFWTWPGFDSMSSRLKAGAQLIEGLVFMHKNGVSHGDIQEGNIVWNHEEYRAIAPDGTAYQRTNFDFRMAYIDFGSSTLFKPNQSPLIHTSKAPPVTLIAPELEKEGTWYDAFAADVYSLGMTLREELRNALTGWGRESYRVADVARETPQWYHQLLETMIDSDPQRRPTAKEALTYICHMAARV
ncbi:kinase-like protein [Neolentinus lepideus HHB14362 ss-1]|uniref:Kinase-like protein n=1 Tax=Neolentinus lepideus HHB14362 ss-1 TaxID=1314782 RepID=A0A165R3S1_9AGAM|nr:kinase-like protein [Neolentinus lepideus HHB14362 ss-1]